MKPEDREPLYQVVWPLGASADAARTPADRLRDLINCWPALG